MSRMELKGVAESSRKLREIARRHPQKAGAALYKRGEFIMTRSKREFVPVKDGILKNSGHVQPPEIKGSDISVVLAYGGEAEAYAVEQHENLSLQHTVGGPKYLERPMMEAVATLAKDLAKDLKLG